MLNLPKLANQKYLDKNVFYKVVLIFVNQAIPLPFNIALNKFLLYFTKSKHFTETVKTKYISINKESKRWNPFNRKFIIGFILSHFISGSSKALGLTNSQARFITFFL